MFQGDNCQKGYVLPGNTNGSTTSAWSAQSAESAQVTAPVASRPEGPTETRELFADVDQEIPVVPTAVVVALAPEKKGT